MAIAPRRSDRLLNPNGTPTTRFARYLEDIADANGTDGANGAPGAQGIQGIQGVQGVPGQNGADGADGLGATAPETVNYTYNPDGTILNISGATTDIDFTYSNGLVLTVDDQTYLKTFAYNGSNQLTGITVT